MTNVVPFPPLPPVQPPFSGPLDPRQSKYYRIAGNIARALVEDERALEAKDTVTGYTASFVDIGRLQELLEEGIRRFDMNDVRERWSVDLAEWMRLSLFGWVQRRKYLQFDLAENGIHITMQTQDDLGYYQYEFDVFPGKVRHRHQPHRTHL